MSIATRALFSQIRFRSLRPGPAERGGRRYVPAFGDAADSIWPAATICYPVAAHEHHSNGLHDLCFSFLTQKARPISPARTRETEYNPSFAAVYVLRHASLQIADVEAVMLLISRPLTFPGCPWSVDEYGVSGTTPTPSFIGAGAGHRLLKTIH